MREIKFRGKSVDDGKWYYGLPYITDDGKKYQIKYNISERGCTFADVIPETISEFTGIKDKNGVEIYEGDKLSMKDEIGNSGIVTVGFEYGGFIVFRGLAWRQIGDYDVEKNTIEIIGNIHEEVEE